MPGFHISVALRPINQVKPKNHAVWVLPTLYVSLFANMAYHIIERVAEPGVAAVCGLNCQISTEGQSFVSNRLLMLTQC